jgi:hypothetical protein
LRKTSFSSAGTTSPASGSPRIRPSLSISALPNFNNEQRSVASLEKEIMRLQEVLKEREVEIGVLEESLKARPVGTSPLAPVDIMITDSNGMLSPTESASATLTPDTMSQFNALRKGIAGGYSDTASSVDVISEADENLERLNELMRYVLLEVGERSSPNGSSRSMAQKESSHREIVDELTNELGQLRRQHDELTKLSHDQVSDLLYSRTTSN